MKILYLFIIASLPFLNGCVAPGSGLGRIGFKAEVKLEEDTPVTIQVFLSKEYGLGGLDRYFGNPEDYGRIDHEILAERNEEKKFKIEFPPVVYHIDFWLIPPLGARPKHPPAPFYYLRFSESPEEIYIIGIGKNGFDYRVYDRVSRQEMEKETANWIIESGNYEPETINDGETVYYLTVQIKKPNNIRSSRAEERSSGLNDG